MEALDSRLIRNSGISKFDKRLRPARELRFRLFEAACSRACKKVRRQDDNKALTLFEICQDLAFTKRGLPVPPSSKAFDPDLVLLAKEGMR